MKAEGSKVSSRAERLARRNAHRGSSAERSPSGKRAKLTLRLFRRSQLKRLPTYQSLKQCLKKRLAAIRAHETPRISQDRSNAVSIPRAQSDVCLQAKDLDLIPRKRTTPRIGLGTPPHAEQGTLREPSTYTAPEWIERGISRCPPAVTLELNRIAFEQFYRDRRSHREDRKWSEDNYMQIPRPGEPIPKSPPFDVTAGMIYALKREKRINKLAYEWRTGVHGSGFFEKLQYREGLKSAMRNLGMKKRIPRRAGSTLRTIWLADSD